MTEPEGHPLDAKSPLSVEGENAVMAKLSKLKQVVAKNGPPEYGTDIWLDLCVGGRQKGWVLGIQVKTGDSFFRKKELGPDGEDTGYWFAADNDHFTFWFQHSNPHLIVLYEPEAEIAYWAHIREDVTQAIPARDGGHSKRKEMLVPAVNIIARGSGCIDEFMKIARSKFLQYPGDGSIWHDPNEPPLAKEIVLRTALLVPRLVTPHLNQGREGRRDGITGIGMLLSGHGHYLLLEEFAGDERLEASGNIQPPQVVEDETTKWEASFFKAFRQWINAGDSSGLDEPLRTASLPSQRVAAAVVSICSKVNYGAISDALTELRAIRTSDMTVIDQSWLKCHEAQLMLELGNEAEALALAAKWLEAIRKEPKDRSVSAIIAALAEVVTRLSSWEQQDIKGLIQARDNHSAWWRSYSLESPMTTEIDYSFSQLAETSANPSPINLDPYNRILAAGYTSLFAGNYSAWRGYEKDRAKADYIHLGRSRVEDGTITNILSSLRIAGDEKAVTALAKRLWMTGPSENLASVVAQAGKDELTISGFRAMVGLMKEAGDLVAPAAQERLLNAFVEALAGEGFYAHRLEHSLAGQRELMVAVQRLLIGASPELESSVVLMLLGMAEHVHQHVLEAFSPLISEVSEQFVTDHQAELDVWMAEHLESTVTPALARRLVDVSVAAQQAAVSGIAEGKVSLIDVIDREFVPPEAVEAFMDKWLGHMQGAIEHATNGGAGFGGPDVAAVVTLVSLKVPSAARWSAIVEFLANEQVWGFLKARTLQIVSDHVAELPVDIRNQIVDLLERGMPARDFDHPGFMSKDSLGGTTDLALAVLRDPNSATVLERIQALALGTTQQQVDAIEMIKKTGAQAPFVIAILCRSEVQTVRFEAVSQRNFATVVRGTNADLDDLVGRLESESDGCAQSVRLASRLAGALARSEITATEIIPGRMTKVAEVLGSSRSVWARREAGKLMVSVSV